MYIKNIHAKPINLKSGQVLPGKTGDATNAEIAFLLPMGRIEPVKDTPVKPVAAKKAASKKKAVSKPKAVPKPRPEGTPHA